MCGLKLFQALLFFFSLLINCLLFANAHTGVVYIEQEKQYIQEKKEILVCIEPGWRPFKNIENGKQIGMTAEYCAGSVSRYFVKSTN